jgi:hypothetical protein
MIDAIFHRAASVVVSNFFSEVNMGTTLIVTAGPVNAASIRGTKPQKLYRGVQRTLIRKTLAKLNSILNLDTRHYNRGLMIDVTFPSVMGADNSANGRAFVRVMARLRECLDAKVGDE